MGPILIGTSGWTYRDWRGRFYPPKLPQRAWLAYYAERFSTVELNVTTYRLPKEHDLARWSAVPPGFAYTVKLSRLITHRKRPGEPRAFVDNYMRAIAPLEPHVANLLAQFPPFFSRDDDALRGFLDTLLPQHRYVVEFRDPSWYAEPVYALLRERRISLCLHDLRSSVAPLVVTGPVLYVRLHGPVRLRGLVPPRKARAVGADHSRAGAAGRGDVRLLQQRREGIRAAQRRDAARAPRRMKIAESDSPLIEPAGRNLWKDRQVARPRPE